MKTKEIRDLKPEEIESKLTDKRQELMNLRFQQVTGQLTDTSQLRLVRRDIARLETILAEGKSSAVEGEA
ncbi:MAG: 50S ribosomal protein L29 [Chloroflexota bacterium]